MERERSRSPQGKKGTDSGMAKGSTNDGKDSQGTNLNDGKDAEGAFEDKDSQETLILGRDYTPPDESTDYLKPLERKDYKGIIPVHHPSNPIASNGMRKTGSWSRYDHSDLEDSR